MCPIGFYSLIPVLEQYDPIQLPKPIGLSTTSRHNSNSACGIRDGDDNLPKISRHSLLRKIQAELRTALLGSPLPKRRSELRQEPLTRRTLIFTNRDGELLPLLSFNLFRFGSYVLRPTTTSSSSSFTFSFFFFFFFFFPFFVLFFFSSQVRRNFSSPCTESSFFYWRFL